MRIVVDAMGTDHHPEPDVVGSIQAAREYGYTMLLVGDQSQINGVIAQHDVKGLNLEVIHAEEMIRMDDNPIQAAKNKPRSSMHVGMQLVKDGRADGFVTMGNTGAALSVATLYVLKRIPGVKRPALSGVYPLQGRRIIMLDVGANADSRPEWLAQYALMGSIYAQRVLGVPEPRVALLSNGEEEGKGNALIKESSMLIQELPVNYIGNIEPKELVQASADVVVSDGFVGNIFVKTFEASTAFLTQLIRDEIKRDVFSMVGGLLLKPAFRRARQRSDTFEVGGVPLLGVNGVVIIGHGRSNAYAVKNAIHQAGLAVQGQIIDAIQSGLTPD